MKCFSRPSPRLGFSLLLRVPTGSTRRTAPLTRHARPFHVRPVPFVAVDPNAEQHSGEPKDGEEEEAVNIFAAAEKGDIAGVDDALRAGVEIDTRAESGATPLIAAAVAQQTATVAHLLERGADPNAVKKNGDGALHWACYRGEAAIVAELMAYGADVNRPGELKNTPLHLACTNHHEEIAAVLLMRGAAAAARNQYGITPYGVATKQAVKEVVQSVEKGGDIARGKLRAALARKMSAAGGTSLHFASRHFTSHRFTSHCRSLFSRLNSSK